MSSQYFFWNPEEIDFKKDTPIREDLLPLFLHNIAAVAFLNYGRDYDEALAEATQAYERGLGKEFLAEKFPPIIDFDSVPPRHNRLTKFIKDHYGIINA